MANASGRRLSDLFPTRWSLVIFILYMALFINQGILVTASQTSNRKGYGYNTVLAVLLTELIKLLVSAGTFIHSNSVGIFCLEIKQNSKVFFLYFIPAGLYCLYNNLAYTNLVNFDPTTYFLLLQLRVVVTGIVFQILFQKRLSRHQWISLGCLTVGCMVKELNFKFFLDSDALSVELKKDAEQGSSINKTTKGFLENPVGILLIFLQVVCSSGAGVYNEYLLKRPASSNSSGKQLPVLIQNVCLYIDSIVCNIVLLLWQGNASAALLDFDALQRILSTPIILAVVLNNAAIGIVTSFFLAQLNSILKTFASALELMFTAVLCWIIFDIPVYTNTAIAIAIVTFAIWLYAKEPVQNTNTANASIKVKNEADDMQKMLNEELDV